MMWLQRGVRRETNLEQELLTTTRKQELAPPSQNPCTSFGPQFLQFSRFSKFENLANIPHREFTIQQQHTTQGHTAWSWCQYITLYHYDCLVTDVLRNYLSVPKQSLAEDPEGQLQAAHPAAGHYQGSLGYVPRSSFTNKQPNVNNIYIDAIQGSHLSPEERYVKITLTLGVLINSFSPEWDIIANKLVTPLRHACETRQSKIMGTALDCLQVKNSSSFCVDLNLITFLFRN